jgi:Alpha-2-macroglobulin family/Bacterial Alpha-2-macroglobulin MG10 domain
MKIFLLKCIALLIVFFTFSTAHAQQLKHIQNRDTLFHLYTLDDAQLLYLLNQQTVKDTNWLFTHPYKKIAKDFYLMYDSIAPGSYLQATINGNMVSYILMQKMPFTYTTKKIDDDIIIFLKNSNNQNYLDKHVIANAKITFNKNVIPYDSSYGGYVTNAKMLGEKLKLKYIEVALNEAHYLLQLNYTPPVTSKQLKYKKIFNNQMYGYAITDKPIYKLGDTLNFKTYILDNRNGKPLKTKLNLNISDAQTSKIILKEKLNCVSDGAYTYKWVLPDTLLQDRNYNITYYYNVSNAIVSNTKTIKVASYLLNKNVISVSPSKQSYKAGEDIIINARTADANGFAIGDVHLKYTISLQNINGTLKDSLLITKQMREHFVEVDTILPYEKLHQFKIKYAQLPLAKFSLNVLGTANDPQFEKTDFNFNINYTAELDEIFFYQAKDSVVVKYNYLTKDSSKPFVLKSYAGNKLIDSIKITTPYNYKLIPEITSVQLWDSAKYFQSINVFFNTLEIMKAKGERTNKAFTISFKYPFAEPVHYRIYKGKDILKKGCSTNLEFETTDSSLDGYSILLGNNLNGNIEQNFYRLSYFPLGKKINIATTLPADAFPGQTIPVAFAATDWYGKPIANFNMASYAVNAMFENSLSTPYVDVPKEYKQDFNLESLNQTYANLYFLPYSFSGIAYITTTHIARYNLYKNEFYQLMYPKGGMQIIYNPKHLPTPELTVAVTFRGATYTPKYFQIDSNLMAVGRVNNVSRYSFLCDSGKHNIIVRAFDRLISVPNVMLKKYSKTYLAINLDSLYAHSYTNNITLSDSMSMMTPNDYERKKLENSLLFFNGLYFNNNFKIANNTPKVNAYSLRSNYLESVRIDDDNFNTIGPINTAESVLLNLDSRNYNLNKGKFIHYYNANTQVFTSKAMDKKSVIDLPFQEQPFAYSYLPYQSEADTVAPVEIVQKTYSTYYPAKPSKRFNFENYFYQNSIYTANDSFFQVHIFQGVKKQITHCWIINPDNIDKSIFGGTYQIGYTFTSFNANKPVDIYFFCSDNTMRVFKNVSFPANSILYINPDYLTTDSIQENKLSKALEVFNAVTKIPMLPFYFSPLESNDLKLENTSISNALGKAYLKGNIVNEQLAGLPATLILLEQGGRFKYGAQTNSKGEFEFLKIPPGVYDIKIYNPRFSIKYYYQVNVGGAKGQYFTSILNAIEGQMPVIENITNAYRYSAWDNSNKNSLQLNMYDYTTRQALIDYSVSFEQEGKPKIKINTTEKIYEYIHNGLPYNLIISKAGYKTIEMRGITLGSNYVQKIDVFMTPSTKNSMPEIFSFNNILYRSEPLNPVGIDANYYTTNAESPMLNASGSTISYNYTSAAAPIQNVVVTGKRKKAFIDASKPGSGPALSGQQIAKMATTNVLESASNRPGTYQSKSGADISLGSGRASNIVYMVDGILVRDEAMAKTEEEYEYDEVILEGKDNLGIEESKKEVREDQGAKMNNLFNTIINGGFGNQYRKTFNDVGYWQPNLVTDKEGKAYCNIKLPDNITQWKTYTIGMGESYYYGLAQQDLKTYKPMQTITYAPTFLHQGDSIYLKAKFTNLLPEAKKCNLFFDINTKIAKEYSFDLTTYTTDSVFTFAKYVEPITFTAGLKYLDKYTDAETVTIPVLSNAITLYNTQNIYADADSVYTLKFDSNISGKIIFNNIIYERILQYIDDLNNYQYGCVEQTSSKLKALLYQQFIYGQLQKKFASANLITKCINKLGDMQNNNGSFGWWRKGEADIRMTTYALEALMLAQSKGYSVPMATDAANFLIKKTKKNINPDYLYTWYVLLKNNLLTTEDIDLSKIVEINLNPTDKIYLYKLRQIKSETIDNATWYSLMLELQNNVRVNYCDNFFYDHRANVFNAFTIFKGTGIGAEFSIMFRTKITNGQLGNNLNTFSKAALIEAMLADASETKAPVMADVILNDTQKIKSFPFTIDIKNTILKIAHKGAPVWVNTAEAYQIENPNVHDSIFSISTYFTEASNKVSGLTRGVNTQLHINVMAYKTKDYVMIEVPLPAGVIIKNKPALPNTKDFIEYKNDKIIIFKTNMALGNNNFVIDVQPMYTGTFNMPPAQVGMMYYPFVFGNNVKSAVPVK